jgi:hypothetical protein
MVIPHWHICASGERIPGGQKMYGSHAAIHAATEKRRKMEADEEEIMTQYNRDDLEGDWEFKIVRSTFGSFRNPRTLNSLLEDEALAGWEMVEKFDDNRVRFKRPRSARVNDGMLPNNYDPYRTQFGAFGSRGALVAGVILGLVLLLLGFFVFYLNLAG